MHAMIQERKTWIAGYLVKLILVRHNEACNPELSELVMPDGRRFLVCEDNCFTQWIYLALPEAFKMALVGTRWEQSNQQYLKASRIILHQHMLLLEITVNLVLAACSGEGIRLEPTFFQIRFREMINHI